MNTDALTKTDDGEYKFDVLSEEVKDLLVAGESAIWIDIPYAGITVEITYDRVKDIVYTDLWTLDSDDDYPIASASTAKEK